MRLAFVTPRYGADVLGGAEALVREAAHGLAGRGHEVEVLTTCALDAATWRNELPEGTLADGAVTVRRHPTVATDDPARRDALDHRVLAGGNVSDADELAWAASRYEAPGLVRHLVEEGGGYDAVLFAPYLAWTTLRCLPLVAPHSVLVPCLHDEPAARLRSVRALLAGAGSLWFLSEPEHGLAHRLAPLAAHRVVGAGVGVPAGYDPEGFRRRHGIARPFALYAGRREDGKGWPQALAGFAVAVDRHGLELDLVTIGTPGAPQVPSSLSGRVRSLGFLAASEVPDAFAAATAYLQPSVHESFSRTVMESWLAGTPVVAATAGEVVAWHCERSGGGLLYGDELELAACLRALCEQPAAAGALAEAGRRYVLEHCTWPPVLDSMESALEDLGREGPDCAGALSAGVRRDVAAERSSLAAPSGPRAPLSEWLPAPGAGVPAWGTAGAGVPVWGTAAGTLARRLGRAVRGAVRGWRDGG